MHRTAMAALLCGGLAGGMPAQAQVSSTDDAGHCRFAIANFRIPGGDMAPSLAAGQVVWAVCLRHAVAGARDQAADLHLSGSMRTVQRGDLVMVRLPSAEPNVLASKRVIGLPGDRVQISQGIIRINGSDISRQRIADWRGKDSRDQDVTSAQYREALPSGKSYSVLDGPPSTGAETVPEQMVPPGHVFVVGDNRLDSFDSRYADFGLPPFEALIGVLAFDNAEVEHLQDELAHTLTGPRQERGL